MTKKTVAIVPAAGRGVRMGKEKPKQFLEICGRPILAYTLDVLFSVHFLSGIFLVVPQDFLRQAEELVGNCRTGGTGAFSRSGRRGDVAGISSYMPQAQGCTQRKDADFFIRVVAGGAERQESVLNALRVLPADCDWVLIHDGVRPFASAGLMEETWKAAQSTGAAIAALPATDTVKRVNRQRVIETLPREQIWLVQTPQVFRKDVILSAYGEARAHGWSGTDDASLVERLDVPVSVVRGECSNIKVTAPEDLGWAAWFLNRHFDGAYGE